MQIYTVLCKVIMRSCNNKHKKKLLIFGCFMQQMLILTHILYVVMKLKMSEIVIKVLKMLILCSKSDIMLNKMKIISAAG